MTILQSFVAKEHFRKMPWLHVIKEVHIMSSKSPHFFTDIKLLIFIKCGIMRVGVTLVMQTKSVVIDVIITPG